jgi:drug/metabolite transporter (DMT)-like permease
MAALYIAVAAAIINTVPGGLKFVCPPDDASSTPSCKAWHIPLNLQTILPLLYWILLASVLAYLLMTWANKYANPSNVLIYTSLQPLASSYLTIAILASGYHGDLEWPGYNSFGGVLIVGGLLLLVVDRRREEKLGKETEDEQPEQRLLSEAERSSC